ncbi:MAG: glycosyltransferase, partial [Gemmatimonadaceae bacterium]
RCQPMKVLHVAPSIARSYGGPTQSLAGYAVAARNAGIDVSIAAPRCDYDDLNAFRRRAGGTRLHLFRAYGTGAFAASPSLVRWVSRAASAYDVVHIHGLFNPISTLSARAVLRSGTTVVIRPFGTLSRYTFRHRRTRLKNAYFSLVERRNVVEAAALHFTTDTERDSAGWHDMDIADRAHVVPPPWLGRDHRAKERPPFGGEVVVFLGRIAPVKNIETLLDAWPSVSRSKPRGRLLIAGSGDRGYLRALERRAHDLGILDSIEFRGFLSGEEKQSLLCSASVLVLPSHHENFGIAVLESLDAGVPVVVSAEVQLADFVRRHDVGKVVQSTPAGLASAIIDTLNDGTLGARTREIGAEVVAKEFAPPIIGDLLSSMYHAAQQRSR